MKSVLWCVGAAASIFTATSAGAAMQVITPVAAGGGNGQWVTIAADFDAQPIWDAVLSAPVGGGGAEGGLASWMAGRHGYIDFGVDYADIAIHETWTQYNDWAQGPQAIFNAMQWTNLNPASADRWDAVGNVAETQLKLSSHPALPYTGEVNPWYKDATYAAPITPQGRYLLLQISGTATGRDQEFAFIGTVPEPASLALLAAGGLLLAPRRR